MPSTTVGWRNLSSTESRISASCDLPTNIVLGFQSEVEAKRFQGDLEERLREFNLELHPKKTRLLEFGPFAAENRRRRGEGKPETFDFLGFRHNRGHRAMGRSATPRPMLSG